jgi:hypothetical protein
MHQRRNLAAASAVVAVVLCLLLSLAVDPGSGTGTNLQAADDVAGLVVGAHHAKPLPASDVGQLQGLLLAAAVAVIVVVVVVRSGGPLGRVRTASDDRFAHEAATGIGRAWRAPPAPASA